VTSANLTVRSEYEASEYEARQLTSQIQSGLATVFELLGRIYVYELWRYLDYENWSAYCRAEFAERLPVSKMKRHKIIGALTEAGMSGREIEAALQVSRETVRRDLAALAAADTNVSGPCLQCNQPPPVLVTEYEDEEADRLRQVAELILTINLPKGTAKARLDAISAAVKRIKAGEAAIQ
jgi:HTH domain